MNLVRYGDQTTSCIGASAGSVESCPGLISLRIPQLKKRLACTEDFGLPVMNPFKDGIKSCSEKGAESRSEPFGNPQHHLGSDVYTKQVTYNRSNGSWRNLVYKQVQMLERY